MASPDLEKRALLPAEDNTGLSETTSPKKPQRRRLFVWLTVLVAVLLLVAARTASGPCPSRRSRHGVFQPSKTRPVQPLPPAINSRSPNPRIHDNAIAAGTTSAAAPARTVLKTFEVDQPVLLPGGPAESDGSSSTGTVFSAEPCTVLLMRHDFAFSYGTPFVGDYTPPSCDFNRVVINFTVVSQGRQFDRLALMYFGDTEVWRTSTEEPTTPPGISWTYLKDMTHYLYFWKSPQKVIFDLGNLIDDKYTGIYNTTLTATFFNSDVETDQAPPSDLIIPISARQGASNGVSQFTLPAQNATNTISFPQNARRAVFSVSANGQANEEFWWSNVLEGDVYTFNATAGALPGLSPFREVQVLIDGQLAGVDWPFPVIFTGGVVPSLHRPVVGIEAFDLREHEIDITPFLPLLCDGREHTFTIRVAGLNNTGASTSATLTETVNESWYVTGKIFVWLDDDASSVTTGDPPTIVHTPPVIAITRHLTTAPNGTNETLTYTTSVKRSLQISTRNLRTQHSSSSSNQHAAWTQSLTYTNNGLVSGYGYNQYNDFLISGQDSATLPPPSTSSSSSSSHQQQPQQPFSSSSSYLATYRYPLLANQTYSVSPQGNLSIWAYVRQGKELSLAGASVFPSGLEAFASTSLPGNKYEYVTGQTATLKTSKEGTASFYESGDSKSSSGFGEGRQVFWFGVGDGTTDGEELYYRDVQAVNGSVVADEKRLEGRPWVAGGSGKRDGVVVQYGEW